MRPLQRLLLVRRRQQVRRPPSAAALPAWLSTSALGVLLIVLLLFTAGGAYARLTAGLPSLQRLEADLNPRDGLLLQPTRLYDRTGQNLLYSLESPSIPRRYLYLDPAVPEHLSPYLVQVTVALNQPDFWASPGVAWRSLTDERPRTLAEELVSDLLLENEPAGLRRTLRMRLLAAQVTAQYGRAQVLEWYLNSAYFGRLAYGADAAANLYLGKSASQLDLPEAVLLASVAQSPALNPLDARTAALENYQAALQRLLAQGVIQSDTYTSAQQAALSLQNPPADAVQLSPAFNRLVLDELYARFGRGRVERGGLRVITSLDYDLQRQINCAARTQLARLQGLTVSGAEDCAAARLLPTLPPASQSLPSGSLASAALLDLPTGQLLALLGDTTTAGETPRLSAHQPGTLLTPFTALTAFARGFSPASLVWDIPASLPADLAEYRQPETAYRGPQRLRLAVANDDLAPLAQLLYQIGPANTWRQVEPLGLTLLDGRANPGELFFTGGSVNLLQIAQAYSTFANLGVQRGTARSDDGPLSPVTLVTVEDIHGQVWLALAAPQENSLVSPQLAYLIHHMLADEPARWPSLGYPNPLETGRPTGAKTGQTARGDEVWAVGYSRQMLSVVWMGLPAEAPTEARLQPRMAAGLWHAAFQYAHRDLPLADWPVPEGLSTLTVCTPSGKLPTSQCPTQVEEIFLSGSEPVEADDLYRTVQVNRETNRLATVFTPRELVKEQTYLVVPSEALSWARAAGIELPPAAYDDILVPAPLPGVVITQPQIFSFVHGQVPILGEAGGAGFASYRVQVGAGLNPQSWLLVGSESQTPVSGGPLAQWDTQALPDGLYAVRLVVVRQDQTLQSAVIQVSVDNTLPQAALTYPAPQQRFSRADSRTINFLAQISDSGGIARVEWWLDGIKIGENQQAPYSTPWVPIPGEHSLVVRAADRAGNTVDSPAVIFRVE